MYRRRVDIDVEMVGSGGGDLQYRSCRHVASGHVETLAFRAEALNCKDRALMRMYLDGAKIGHLARLAGKSESTILRRIHRISTRLVDPEYTAFLRNRGKFSKEQAAVARDHYIDGLSMKKIAAKRGITEYRVKQALERIKRVTSLQQPAARKQ